MPHSSDERATSLAVRRILQSEEIRDFLKDGVMRGEGERATLSAAALPKQGVSPGLVLAIDGSLQPVSVHSGFPGSEVAYFSFASVLLDMELVDKLEASRPANPAEFSKVTSVTPQVMVLPGKNFRQTRDASPVASFRRVCFEQLGKVGFDPKVESLLQTYEALLQHRTFRDELPSPDSACRDSALAKVPKSGAAKCGCSNQCALYSTDWLRIHQGFNDIGENGAAYSEFMQVTERLWLVNFLRTLEKNRYSQLLKRLPWYWTGRSQFSVILPG